MSATRTAANRLPSLDGLRALSIGLVVVAHLANTGKAPILKSLWRFDLGNLGVRVFFVISGLLITSLLLEESAATGRIHLLHFYLRRLLRIAPAYYVFVGAVAVAGMVGILDVTWSDFIAPLTWTSNYVPTSYLLGHTWSLSVEEQFYLLWPATLMLLGPRRATFVALSLIVIAPLSRWIGRIDHDLIGNPRYAFPAVADALACGCLLALARTRLHRWETYRRAIHARWTALLPVAILVAQCASDKTKDLWMYTIINALIAVTIDRLVVLPDTWSGRVLNARPVVALGLLSYSIYLWQQPFMDPSVGVPLPLSLFALGLVAYASYRFIERPMSAFRRKLVHQGDKGNSALEVIDGRVIEVSEPPEPIAP